MLAPVHAVTMTGPQPALCMIPPPLVAVISTRPAPALIKVRRALLVIMPMMALVPLVHLCITYPTAGTEAILPLVFVLFPLNDVAIRKVKCLPPILMSMSLKAEPHLAAPVMMGSSRSSGGIARGRALGGHFNIADAQKVWGDINAHETLAIGPKEKGKIFVYQSSSDPNTVDISSTKSSFAVRVADTAQYTTIQDIVRRIAQDYSPIQKPTVQLFFLDDVDWIAFGRYEAITHRDLVSEDNIDWLKKDGLKVVHILASTYDLSPGLISGLPGRIGSISSQSSLPSGSYSGI
ncbi:hypothetical protein CVT25_012550 [Psilocybe cyanescens]|uniref:Uncharacterized protein n=1 Tax=Psilocybe cyanescens TaxID=93625 RepID=A0A409XK42_PSICY|nr:hypothetical protein CVT25_012550 [Psilocybe cyanescens]